MKKVEKRKAKVKRAMPPPRATINTPITFTELEQDYMPARETREAEIKECGT